MKYVFERSSYFLFQPLLPLRATTLECSLVHQEYVFQFTTWKIRPKFASQMEAKHDDVPRYLKDAIANTVRSETSKVRFFVSLDLLPHIAFIHQKYTFLGD